MSKKKVENKMSSLRPSRPIRCAGWRQKTTHEWARACVCDFLFSTSGNSTLEGGSFVGKNSLEKSTSYGPKRRVVHFVVWRTGARVREKAFVLRSFRFNTVSFVELLEPRKSNQLWHCLLMVRSRTINCGTVKYARVLESVLLYNRVQTRRL